MLFFCNNRRGGLTLLELLLAVVILAGGLAGIVRAYMKCLDARQAARDHSLMVLLAQNMLARELESARESGLVPGERRGQFGAPDEKFAWHVRAIAPGNTAPGVLEVACINENHPLKKDFVLTAYVNP
jgi:type II secretory pathway pseudopilin PulG